MTAAEWSRGVVLRLARVPAEPQVPEGSAESVRVFRAGRKYFVLRLIVWGMGNAVIALGLLLLLAFTFVPKLAPLARTILQALWAVAAGVFAASLPITYFLQKLNYEMRWYVVTDRSLRIRSGVVWLREMTMTFANIQEVRLNANPVERWLGLANVEVRSAGGGEAGPHGAQSSGHVAAFAGVDNAAVIRDLIVERLRAYRGSGLGEATEEVTEAAELAAAREVLQEARALRNSLVRLSSTQG